MRKPPEKAPAKAAAKAKVPPKPPEKAHAKPAKPRVHASAKPVEEVWAYSTRTLEDKETPQVVVEEPIVLPEPGPGPEAAPETAEVTPMHAPVQEAPVWTGRPWAIGDRAWVRRLRTVVTLLKPMGDQNWKCRTPDGDRVVVEAVELDRVLPVRVVD
jgi:hypothetical protein